VLFPPLGVGDNFLLWGKGSLKFSPLIGGGETGCKRCNLLGGWQLNQELEGGEV
jgi:hypothetical protein